MASYRPLSQERVTMAKSSKFADFHLCRSLPERCPYLWNWMDEELGKLSVEASEGRLPVCAGFHPAVERLARQLVAEVTDRASTRIAALREKQWDVVDTSINCFAEQGLPISVALPRRTSQLAVEIVAEIVARSVVAAEAARQQEWDSLNAADTDLLAESPSIELLCGLPIGRGLPRRAQQLAVCLVSEAIAKARSSQCVLADVIHDDVNEDVELPMGHAQQCPICLGAKKRPVELPCGHIFCADCLLQHAVRQRGHFCPLCRGVLFNQRSNDGPDSERSESIYDYGGAYSHDYWDGIYQSYIDETIRHSFYLCGWFVYCSISKAVPEVSAMDSARSDFPRQDIPGHESGVSVAMIEANSQVA